MKTKALIASSRLLAFTLFSSSAMAMEDVSDLTTSNRMLGSKSSKNCPTPTPNMTCGRTFENGAVITLNNDLICNGNITEADDTRNAAITLKGKNTVLDCQRRSISQLTTSTASAIDCKVYPGNSSERLLMKQECGLFYEYGILIQDGATVKNCNVKKFWSGGFIEDGGVIENSHFSLNNVGVTVSNEIPNTMSKVLKSNFYSNAAGLTIFQKNEGGDAKVLLEEVVSNNNAQLASGIQISGTGITLRNVEASNNIGDGISIVGYYTVPPNPYPRTDVTFEGKVSLNYNILPAGLWIVNGFGIPTSGIVRITGDLNIDRNALWGVVIGNETDVSIVLGKGSSPRQPASKSNFGSLISCGNGFYDIWNDGKGDFEGTDYTCGKTFSFNNADLPVCQPCPHCSLFSRTLETASVNAITLEQQANDIDSDFRFVAET